MPGNGPNPTVKVPKFWRKDMANGVRMIGTESKKIPGNKITTFNIDLEYFNVTSSKRILALLYKLNELSDDGIHVNVNWYYREGDEDMYEVGQDYAYMVKVPFEFKAYKDSDLAIAI